MPDFKVGTHSVPYNVGTPAAAPEHPVETPASSPVHRAANPEGMPRGRHGSGTPLGVRVGRPRVSLAALPGRTRTALLDSIAAGVESQGEIALAQAKASAEGFAISAAHQQVNSALHMAQNALDTQVKAQNKQSDSAKDAI